MVASETLETVEFCVRAPESVTASIMVDRNQNGRIDSGTDTMYSLNPSQQVCPVFFLTKGSTTYCGKFPSGARLTEMHHEHGEWEYTYSVPKAELSFSTPSVWISMYFWDSIRRARWYFPSADLRSSIHIRYEIKGDVRRH